MDGSEVFTAYTIREIALTLEAISTSEIRSPSKRPHGAISQMAVTFE
jgi:hypothetical protein